VVFLGIATAMVAFALNWFGRISDSELLHRGYSLAPGVPQWRLLSSVYLISALTLVAWLWSRLLEHNSAMAAYSVKWFMMAGVAAACGHAGLYIGIDWDKGFGGPKLLRNMFYQGLNTPFKPIIAHFVYFGPCFIIVLRLLCLPDQPSVSRRPLQIAVMGFLPLLLVGSESRQWIAILPFLVAYVAQSDLSDRQQRLLLFASIILATPLFWLAKSVAQAFFADMPMTDPLWQFYFGRHGPWMSHDTYLIATLALSAFVTAWWFTRSPAVKTSEQTV
jgi:hypothetical protein